jgi:hypothetical protein
MNNVANVLCTRAGMSASWFQPLGREHVGRLEALNGLVHEW